MLRHLMKSMQHSNWILGALAAALWIAPAAAQTASGTSGTNSSTASGDEPDREGQATSATELQVTTGTAATTSGTGSGGETERVGEATSAEDTTGRTGTGSTTSGTSAKGKDPARSLLNEDPGAWPRSGRSASDRPSERGQ